ncbi:MAG: response regulator transcription factor [Acidobacteriota bacterium]
MKKILIVEDDLNLFKNLKVHLENEYFDVIHAEDGEKCLELVKREKVDLIILDIVLPKISGFDVMKKIRESGIATSVLMLSGKRKNEMDKVLGLEIGADDYVTKPFSTRELVARVKAILRRKIPKKIELDEYSFRNIHLDFKKQEAYKAGKKIKLSPKEFKILKFFVSHEGEVATRDMLLNEVWGYEVFPTTRTVDNFILSLRKKIEDNPSKPKHILTIHGSGYKFIK